MHYSKQTPISASAEDLFAYHEAEGAFKRLNPPWEPVEVVLNDGSIQDGSRVELKMKIGPISQYFRLVHRNYRKNEQFEDHQVSGPFAAWRHTHRMIPQGENRSLLEDHIEYQLPLGLLGRIFGARFAHAKLERMFSYRHRITQNDLAIHQTYKKRQSFAIVGENELIRSQLIPFLTTGGHTVKPDSDDVDVVIHLGGKRPKVQEAQTLISVTDEENFPPVVLGPRVVILQIGIVLAFQNIPRPPKNAESIHWIALDDLLGMILHAAQNPDMQGVYGAVAPGSVSSRDYLKALQKNRFLPAFTLPLFFGKEAKNAEMNSPAAYPFRYPDLDSALDHVLGRR